MRAPRWIGFFVGMTGLAIMGLTAIAQTPPVAAPPAAEEAKAPAISDALRLEIEAIQRYYMEVGDFRMTFVQRYYSKMTQRVKTSEGAVDFAQPMKMRWDYEKPEKRSFITDGKSLWMVMWDEKECKVFKDLRSSDLESSVAFLWGGGDIAERYSVTRLKLDLLEGKIEVKGRTVLELIPTTANSQFDTLYLLVDPKTHRIEEAAFIDQLSNLNHMIFSAPDTGKRFKPDHFQFTAPGPDWMLVNMDY
jgi:outer membrane lipoprotein carrier protein